jgi:hypothetical protein
LVECFASGHCAKKGSRLSSTRLGQILAEPGDGIAIVRATPLKPVSPFDNLQLVPWSTLRCQSISYRFLKHGKSMCLGRSLQAQTNPFSYAWPSNYPDYKELRKYFDYCDEVLDIKSNTAFESVVVGAKFNTDEGRWHVKTADGRTAKAKYLVVAAGFAAKRYVPPWDGIDKFKGIIHHSSFWPDEEIDVKGKKCAIIGTGATGVQITQAWGPVAGEVKVNCISCNRFSYADICHRSSNVHQTSLCLCVAAQ